MPKTTSPAADADQIPTRLLVLGMAHDDGTIHGTELYPVAEACGQSAEQVRSCLRRLVSDGLFERTGEGREALFRPTPSGRAALDAYLERTRLAYVQDAQGKGWDRSWHLIGFAVPEAQRHARNQLRDRLLLLGGAQIQSGLYVSPHDWHDHVLPEADRLGLTEHVTAATTTDLVVAGTRDPRLIAERLWPLDELRTAYERFVDEFSSLPASLVARRQRHERIAEAEYLAGALAMVMSFRECFDRDPLLPPELLPRPWPGRAARELVAESYRLALLSREEHHHPALFRRYAEVAQQVR